MATTPAGRFWDENEEYHNMAQEFEEGIKIDHPAYLSGRSGCGFCHNCGWAATTVNYYKYAGESLT